MASAGVPPVAKRGSQQGRRYDGGSDGEPRYVDSTICLADDEGADSAIVITGRATANHFCDLMC